MHHVAAEIATRHDRDATNPQMSRDTAWQLTTCITWKTILNPSFATLCKKTQSKTSRFNPWMFAPGVPSMYHSTIPNRIACHSCCEKNPALRHKLATQENRGERHQKQKWGSSLYAPRVCETACMALLEVLRAVLLEQHRCREQKKTPYT